MDINRNLPIFSQDNNINRLQNVVIRAQIKDATIVVGGVRDILQFDYIFDEFYSNFNKIHILGLRQDIVYNMIFG